MADLAARGLVGSDQRHLTHLQLLLARQCGQQPRVVGGESVKPREGPQVTGRVTQVECVPALAACPAGPHRPRSRGQAATCSVLLLGVTLTLNNKDKPMFP